MGTHEHKQDAPRQVSIAILTLSTTRTIKDDTGGHWIKEAAKQLGHNVVYHRVIPDDATTITMTVR